MNANKHLAIFAAMTESPPVLDDAVYWRACRSAKIIAMRSEGATYQAIGDHFGVTRERIRQLEALGFRMFRHPDRRESFRSLLRDGTFAGYPRCDQLKQTIDISRARQ